MNTKIPVCVHADDPIDTLDATGDAPPPGMAFTAAAGPPMLPGTLSAREIDVLRLAADGLDTDEIARKLCYSRRTVANIVHSVIIRFNLNNRTHAVAHAIRVGLI